MGSIHRIAPCRWKMDYDRVRFPRVAPADEQRGWLNDRYGVSWRVCRSRCSKLWRRPLRADRVMTARLQTKTVHLAAL